MPGGNQRKHARWKLEKLLLQPGAGQNVLRIRDASAGGLGLSVDHQVPKGSRIQLKVPTAANLLVVARYCHSTIDGDFTHKVGAAYVYGPQGLLFHQWLLTHHLSAALRNPPPPPEGGADQRRGNRVCVGDGAVWATLNGNGVVVYDLSPGGMALLAGRPLPNGQMLTLELAGQPAVRMAVCHCGELEHSPAGADFRFRIGAVFLNPGDHAGFSATILERYIQDLLQAVALDSGHALPWEEQDEDDDGSRVDLSEF